jgi:alpha-mannosidase
MPQFDKQKVHQLSRVLETIRSAVYKLVGALDVEAFVSAEPLLFSRRLDGERKQLKVGQTWAAAVFDCGWFHFTGVVPAEAAGTDVVLLIDVGGEACVVDAAGNPLQGLTNINSEFDKTLGMPGKHVLPWVNPARGNETIDLWADAGANDLFGRMQDHSVLKQASIAIRQPQLFALYYDWEVLHELMTQLPESSARRWRLWDALDRAAALLIECNEANAAAARSILAPELDRRGGDASLTISAVGHAHMDLAWLWPIRETIRKCARTFATVLRMIERYPDYVFGASQPQQFQWMKEHYPALYQQIKQRVAEGRIETQGVMWVEPDTNVPGGESLIRQIYYGVRFFAEEFGTRSKMLWEPDVFGYTGALPQILKKSGVDFFMTQKLSWNQVTRHPHHTFWWQGIDGSRVLAHMPPEDTYNGPAAPRSIVKIEREYLDKNVSDRALMLFGIGDGGGGPGEEHLERLAREKNLAGLCPVVQEPAETFFQRLTVNSHRYGTWSGELYLEKHQGTFTTQARNKRFNRKLEIALRELELIAAIAQHAGAKYTFPKDEIDAIWREVLLYQFHDILPGSSIARVYDESVTRYHILEKQVVDLIAAADQAYLAGVAKPGDGAIIFNSLSWPRSQWLKVDNRWHYLTVPALGAAVVAAVGAAVVASDASATLPQAPRASEHLLENQYLKVEFAEDGSIRSILDKRCHRQVLTAAGNVLAVYHDPGDAWDFPMDYRERQLGSFKLQSSEAAVDGPRAVIRQVYAFNQSSLTQEISLLADAARLDFVTQVDWKESERMLRTSFPTTVLTHEATCDIQFGSIRRPTHRNTLADVAKMEICAQKFVDLSDRGFGVALLNDCKYGHAVFDGTIDLNLLRSPNHPGIAADRGTHQFSYALLPHPGDHVAGNVIQAGYEFNIPLRVLGHAAGVHPVGGNGSWITVDNTNVVIETIKPAETGSGWVVRLYEATGGSTDATLSLPSGIASVAMVNLIEENPVALSPINGRLALHFGPFEIHTLLLSGV